MSFFNPPLHGWEYFGGALQFAREEEVDGGGETLLHSCG